MKLVILFNEQYYFDKHALNLLIKPCTCTVVDSFYTVVLQQHFGPPGRGFFRFLAPCCGQMLMGFGTGVVPELELDRQCNGAKVTKVGGLGS